METIFTVRNEHLERLIPQEAVDFFGELLWAEAGRTGIPISKTHISNWITVPDGGVDASVEKGFSTHGDLIKAGYTSYEIKTGAAFKPWQDAQIKKQLFGRKRPSKENLGSGVRDCLDKNGTYVFVCFGQNPTDIQYRTALRSLRRYLGQCGYGNAKVDVWGQDKLRGFLKVFPSLALEINQRGGLRFQTHKSWSRESEMKKDFKTGQTQKDFMSNVQHGLCRNGEAVHLRVWGEPGIGKTRLVLEATRTEDLAPLVIYCDRASKFRDGDLMNEILRDDNQFTAILVIDECDPDSRSYIWNKLKDYGARVRLISIYNDHDETSGNTKYLNVPPLENEQLSNIIQGYDIPKDQADRWAELCGGFPRVAHVFGQNLKNNPEDMLKTPDTVNIWDRYIVREDNPNSQQVQQRRLVLRHIALFKRFGYGRRVASEARAIAKKIEQADSRITWPRFQEIIQYLRTSKILQGENTLYITPKPLHIKLWCDWWDTYGQTFSLEDLDNYLKDFTETLIDWFNEMFKYARESGTASRVVKELLGEHGLFQNEN